MDISSISALNTEKNRYYARTIAVPTLITTGAVLAATKADSVSLSTRIAKAGKAGIITALIMGALSLASSDRIKNIIENIKSNLNKDNKQEKETVNAPASEEIPANTAVSEESIASIQPEASSEIETNPQTPVQNPEEVQNLNLNNTPKAPLFNTNSSENETKNSQLTSVSDLFAAKAAK